MSIFDERAERWYERIQACLQRYKEEEAERGVSRKVSQAELVRRMESKYPKEKGRPSLTQVNISRWLSFGGPGKRVSSMPSMEVAIMLADFFGVDVGYLLGETDYKTFEAEDAANYLGLSESAIEHIRLATRLETAFRTVQMLPEEAGKTVSALLSSKGFYGLVKAMKEMDEVYNGPDIQKKLFDELEKKHGAEVLTQAIDLELKPNVHEDEEVDEKVKAAYADFQEALDQSYAADMEKQKSVKAQRYELIQAFSNIVEELYPE